MYFPLEGFKTLLVEAARLEIVEELASAPASERRRIDLARVQALCDHFRSEMTGNRPNCNDGSLAIHIMEDLNRRGQITSKTQSQLLAWCHTDGHLYQLGQPIARQICIELFGHVPPRGK